MDADVSLAIGERGFRWFALAFAITQIVETPLYARALTRSLAGDARPRALPVRLAIAFGASSITHPIVWFAMPAWWTSIYAASLAAGAPSLGVTARTLGYGALAESFAVIAEALYLKAFGVRRAVAWALGANLASVVAGTLVMWLIG